MTTRECTVRDPLGLHARLATQIAAIASGSQGPVGMAFAGVHADASDPMALMRLDVREGERVTVDADGPDAGEAVAAIAALLSGNAGECD